MFLFRKNAMKNSCKSWLFIELWVNENNCTGHRTRTALTSFRVDTLGSCSSTTCTTGTATGRLRMNWRPTKRKSGKLGTTGSVISEPMIGIFLFSTSTLTIPLSCHRLSLVPHRHEIAIIIRTQRTKNKSVHSERMFEIPHFFTCVSFATFLKKEIHLWWYFSWILSHNFMLSKLSLLQGRFDSFNMKLSLSFLILLFFINSICSLLYDISV